MAKRKRFHVSACVTISVHTTVWATSRKEAIAKARDLPMGTIHHSTYQAPMSENGEDWEEWRTSGELDGEPQEITAEESPCR